MRLLSDHTARGVAHPAGLAVQFRMLLGSSGATLPLWGVQVCRLLGGCSWVSLATSQGSGPLRPGLCHLGSSILFLQTSQEAEGE